ncbi:MAG: DUF2029 domain-containing protein [Actinobacteria bacterium]|nr:MAG: DUF2029 domain-containing protein [Actinomycetota bacterium]
MNGRAGIAAVAVIGVVALVRFAPEAVRIDREAREGFGRLAVAALVVALAVCAVHAWRRGLRGALPALPLLLAALPFALRHTKLVLVLALAVLVLAAALELVPWVLRLDAANRRIFGATAAACLVFLGSWTLLHQLWYSPYQIIDTMIYQGYGDQMAAGKVPYRDFELEYPPGALAAFVAPELTAQRGDFGTFGHSFEKWMAGCGIAMVVFVGFGLAALRAPPLETAAALGLAAFSPLLLGNVLLSRFDLLPTALTAAVLAALLLRRDALAGVLLAVAIAVKLYPGVLVPVGVAWIWRRRGREPALRWLALVVGVTAVIFLPFAVISPGGFAHAFGVQLGRPLQLESLGAALLLAAHHVADVHLVLKSDHGSQNIETGAASVLAVLTSIAQVCAIVWVVWTFARGPATKERLVVAAAAAIAAFMAFNKVFSPQFMIWLVPVVALVRGWWPRVLVGASLVLTQLWFPRDYWHLSLEFRARESWLLLARDLFVVALFFVLAWDLQEKRLGEDSAVREPLEPVRGQVEVRPS